MSRRALTFVALGAVLTACGAEDIGDSNGSSGSGGGGGEANGRPIELDALPEVVAHTYCGRMFDCCTADELSEQLSDPLIGDATTPEACEDLYAGLVRALALPGMRASIEQGYASYDAAAVGACLAGIANAACEDVDFGLSDNPLSADCAGAIEPHQADGDPCFSDMDCFSDNCETGEETTGTCQPLPEAGQPCTFRCAGDLRCGFDQDEYRCGLRLAAGESCDVDEDCTSGNCTGEPGQSTCSGDALCTGS
jgi:hypothetical protein